MLKTEQNTTEMERRIRAAFEALYDCCGEPTFEHGQWWVLSVDGDGDTLTFAACDADGPPSQVADGFSFEQV